MEGGKARGNEEREGGKRRGKKERGHEPVRESVDSWSEGERGGY